MFFKVDKKTGFESRAPLVAIYTDEGAPFYIFKRKGHAVQFNLPKGRYMCDDDTFKKLSSPINYKIPKLPAPERIINRPHQIQIVWANNPNKCSIVLEKGLIICDPSFRIKSRQEQEFVMYHELGHYLYKSEHLCDLYATAQMLDKGYNPSQCVFSINGCLSDASATRKKIVANFQKQVKKS